MADNIEALYAQWLAGGSPRVINPLQVQGPNISPMQFADLGGDSKGGKSGFAGLADGILSYMDNKKKEKEKAAGTGVSDAPPPANTFGGGGSQYQGTQPPGPSYPAYDDDERGSQYPDGPNPYMTPDIIETSQLPNAPPQFPDERGSQTGPYDLELERINAWLTMNGAPPVRR